MAKVFDCDIAMQITVRDSGVMDLYFKSEVPLDVFSGMVEALSKQGKKLTGKEIMVGEWQVGQGSERRGM